MPKEMKRKIKCESCGKIIAEGQVPATVEINCPHCGAKNDLNDRSRYIGYTDRLQLEKKDYVAGVIRMPKEKK